MYTYRKQMKTVSEYLSTVYIYILYIYDVYPLRWSLRASQRLDTMAPGDRSVVIQLAGAQVVPQAVPLLCWDGIKSGETHGETM